MENRKGRPGRKKGSGRFDDRVTFKFTSDLREKIEAKAERDKTNFPDALRSALEFGLASTDPGSTRIVAVLAQRDLDDLKRAVRNGWIRDVDYAINEAIRKYLEWLLSSAEARQKTLGNV